MNAPFKAEKLGTSTAVFDAYIDRSWASNAERQRAKGMDFVIGKRSGCHMWNLEGTKRVVDCGNAGGVHSLGHHNPDIAATLRRALDEGRDTGLWAIPNLEYLKLQDMLAEKAPFASLNRSLVTLASTVSVDMAVSFAFRYTGRQKMLAYRHGYHGHSGFAGLVTGSLDEGIIDHYNMPTQHVDFMATYGDPAVMDQVITEEHAAVIVEPQDYETFAPAPEGFLEALQATCRKKGVLFILDETRTGLGRSGKLWMGSYYDIEPDMLITGKGLSGGLYPVSALLTNEAIYDKNMNEHKFSYISSLGGNEISCMVAQKVLELASDPVLLKNVNDMGPKLRDGLFAVAERNPDIFRPGTSYGAATTLEITQPERARDVYQAVFDAGVVCHSTSVILPTVIKYFPCLIMDDAVIEEICDATERAAEALRG
ncbi:MAG: aminotransferase class III-fold pyridoxal phosphate-dependent enzyme [Pseudomonadota bacterium]